MHNAFVSLVKGVPEKDAVKDETKKATGMLSM